MRGWDICQGGQGLWVQESQDGIWGGPSQRGEGSRQQQWPREGQETLVLEMLSSLDKARISMPIGH